LDGTGNSATRSYSLGYPVADRQAACRHLKEALPMSGAFPGFGEPAPWFTSRSDTRERFVFDTVAGRYIVLCFFGSAAEPLSVQVLKLFRA
jgi:hypothetical protein